MRISACAVALTLGLATLMLEAQRRGPKGDGRSEGPEQIVWLAPELSEEVSPGKTKEIRVKFRAADDLDEVEIWLTPSLSKAVTPRVKTLRGLKKGQEYEITLIASMPEVPPQEAFNGTLHMRHQKQTLRSPLQLQIGVGPR